MQNPPQISNFMQFGGLVAEIWTKKCVTSLVKYFLEGPKQKSEENNFLSPCKILLKFKISCNSDIWLRRYGPKMGQKTPFWAYLSNQSSELHEI